MVDDRDGQVYRTVKIGDQVWLAENLNYAYNAPTRHVYDINKQIISGLDSSSFCFDNAPANCAKYGRLYLWSAAMDSAGVIEGNTVNDCGNGSGCYLSLRGSVRGVCPKGWHMPSDEDWYVLFKAVGGYRGCYVSSGSVECFGDVGKTLKSKTVWGTLRWGTENTDSYSFSALPTGFRADDGRFYDEGGLARFWSTGEYDQMAILSNNKDILGQNAMSIALYSDKDDAYQAVYSKDLGLSVRCLKD